MEHHNGSVTWRLVPVMRLLVLFAVQGQSVPPFFVRLSLLKRMSSAA
jgi:hypothetical protein